MPADPAPPRTPDATRTAAASWPGWEAVWVIGGLLFVAGGLLGRMVGADPGALPAYLGAALLGGLVGATELTARYKDAPTVALTTTAGIIYISVNAAVSLAVFWLLHTNQVQVGALDHTGHALSDVLVAGLGSMALLRTSVFSLRVKDTDIAVGPAAVLQVILAAADRACDRDRAGPRAVRVEQIMRGVSFDRARLALPLHCLALMQNVSADEQSQLNLGIAALAAADMSDEVKAYNLGLLLMNYVGVEVLGAAVRGLGAVIQGPAADRPPILSRAAAVPFADLAALIEICVALDPVARDGDAKARSAEWLALDNAALTRESDRVVVVLARLRRYFGPDTLDKAMRLLGAAQATVTPDTGRLTEADLAPPPADPPPA